jgi:serine/threonine protein kinase
MVAGLCAIRTVRSACTARLIQHAFEGSNVLSLANKITNDPVPDIPSKYSPKMHELIEWLLAKDPEQRPSSKQILEH